MVKLFSQELGHDPQNWQLQMDHNRQVHIMPRNNAATGGSSLHTDPPHHHQQQPLASSEHHHDQAVNMAAGSVKVSSDSELRVDHFSFSLQGSRYDMSVHGGVQQHIQHPGQSSIQTLQQNSS